MLLEGLPYLSPHLHTSSLYTPFWGNTKKNWGLSDTNLLVGITWSRAHFGAGILTSLLEKSKGTTLMFPKKRGFCRGHCITNPKKPTILGEIHQNTNRFALFDPHQNLGNLMIHGKSPNKNTYGVVLQLLVEVLNFWIIDDDDDDDEFCRVDPWKTLDSGIL